MKIFGSTQEWILREAQRAREEGRGVPHDLLGPGETDLAWVLRVDNWQENSKRLEPFLVEREIENLPWSITGPVAELFQALLFGNYFAAIALCRAILETILVDRSNSLQYYPGDQQSGWRTLCELIELASRKRPRLKHAMHAVRKRGNYVLHPNEGDLYQDDSERREVAFEVFEHLRTVLEELY